MIRTLAQWILHRWMGWKIKGHFPEELPKYIIAAAPHTSGWDFVMGVLIRAATGLKAGFLAKQSLFRWPHGWFFRAAGGYPVDRSKSNNFVDAAVALFNSKTEMVIALAPEGTRQRVDKLKTGFYYIALGAGIPIVLIRLDYANKVADILPPFYPTGQFEPEMEHIVQSFRGVLGKVPEKSIFF